MKKAAFSILLVFFILLSMSITIYAEDIIITEDTELGVYDPSQYISGEIQDILNSYGAENIESVSTDKLTGIIINLLKKSVSKYSFELKIMLSLTVLAAFIKKIVFSQHFLTAVTYILTLAYIVLIFKIFSQILITSKDVLSELTEILNLILPSLCSILIISGCTLSVLTATASFSAAISFINNVLCNFLSSCVCILIIVMLFEKMTPLLNEMGSFRFVKNTVMNTLKFLTTLLISVISFQTILSAGKDSVAMRTVKFAATNFIPIVGSAVSESMKTITAGIKLLRTSVGTTCIFAVFLTVLPVMIEIYILKCIFAVFSIFSSLMGAQSEKNILETSSDILDIINGIIIFSLLISIITLMLFVTTGLIGAV